MSDMDLDLTDDERASGAPLVIYWPTFEVIYWPTFERETWSV